VNRKSRSKGFNWQERYTAIGRGFMKKVQKSLFNHPFLDRTNTTSIVRRLKKRDFCKDRGEHFNHLRVGWKGEGGRSLSQ